MQTQLCFYLLNIIIADLKKCPSQQFFQIITLCSNVY